MRYGALSTLGAPEIQILSRECPLGIIVGSVSAIGRSVAPSVPEGERPGSRQVSGSPARSSVIALDHLVGIERLALGDGSDWNFRVAIRRFSSLGVAQPLNPEVRVLAHERLVETLEFRDVLVWPIEFVIDPRCRHFRFRDREASSSWRFLPFRMLLKVFIGRSPGVAKPLRTRYITGRKSLIEPRCAPGSLLCNSSAAACPFYVSHLVQLLFQGPA